MTDADDQLSRLFREGPTPERDHVFAAQVMVEVDRMRRRANWVLGLRLGISFAVLTAAALAMGRFSPELPDLSERFGGGEIMSVPIPLVAAGLVVAGVVHLWRRITEGRQAWR
jgi:hypothetical protein